LIHPQKMRSVWIAAILLVVIGVGFFVPFSKTAWIGLLIKAGLFIGVISFAYYFYFDPSHVVAWNRDSSDIQGENSPDTTEEIFQEGSWSGFGEAFQWYYQEFIMVIRDALAASCVGLYLKKGQNNIEFQAGEYEQGQLNRRMLISENSLVDMVAKQKVSILEGNLPIGTELDGFGGLEIRSFLGVPLVWEEKIVGVLALGSDATESFSKEDEAFLCRCGNLLTQVMAVYHRGLRWETDQELYQVHQQMIQSLSRVDSEDNAVYTFVQLIRQLYPFDRFTLCQRDGDEGVIRHVYGQVDGLDRGVPFPLDAGLNGLVLKRNTPLIISDMSEGAFLRPRYFQGEETRHGLHAFLGMPLGQEEEAWGCISLESRSAGQYGEKAKEVLSTLKLYLESVLERFQLEKKIQILQNRETY